MAELPVGLVDDLREATVLGYLDSILVSIAQIETSDPQLAEYLEELAKAFNQDRILALIQKAVDKDADNG
jgi:hypothetical protein